MIEVTTIWGNTVLDVVTMSEEDAEALDEERGPLTTRIREVKSVKLPHRAERYDYAWLNILLVVFFAHALGVASFVSTPDQDEPLAEGLLVRARGTLSELRLAPAPQKTGGGAKAIGREGATAGPKTSARPRMISARGKPNEKELAKNTLAKLFGRDGNTKASALFGNGDLGGELENAIGSVIGSKHGDASGGGGNGGLGVRGDGPGGGGLSLRSVGIRSLDTPGRGGGHDDYGQNGVRRLEKTKTAIEISADPPEISGSLDKEIIRAVIKEHLVQVRYCYEKELIRSPGLFGKVAVEFIIGAEGTVTHAGVKISTMNGGEVGRCVTGKIRTWRFPKPRGGGTVHVKYPFIFTTAG